MAVRKSDPVGLGSGSGLNLVCPAPGEIEAGCAFGSAWRDPKHGAYLKAGAGCVFK